MDEVRRLEGVGRLRHIFGRDNELEPGTNVAKMFALSDVSVTRWIDYLFNIWPFIAMKEIAKEISNVGSKIAKDFLNFIKVACFR